MYRTIYTTNNIDWSLLWPIILGCSILLIIGIVSNIVIFQKHYGLPGWYAIIPIFNSYKQSQKTFGDDYGWVGLLIVVLGMFSGVGYWISILLLIASIWYSWQVYSRLTDSDRLKILAILLPFIGLPIIAFSSNTKYTGPQPPTKEKEKSPKEEEKAFKTWGEESSKAWEEKSSKEEKNL